MRKGPASGIDILSVGKVSKLELGVRLSIFRTAGLQPAEDACWGGCSGE